MATRSARAFIDASKYAAETVSAITATNPSWRFTCLRTPDADAAASFYQENFDFTLLHTYAYPIPIPIPILQSNPTPQKIL